METTIAMRNVAHRGLWNAAVPQNTLEAFNGAWAAGATWVETDFHHTKSGQMICIHAEGELKRYTGCEKAIIDLTPDEVASLRLDPVRFAGAGEAMQAGACKDVGTDFRIPLLDEVLETVPSWGTLQSEIKGYSCEYADIFDSAVRNAGLCEGNIVVSSFNYEALCDFHRRYSKYRTLWLVGVPKDGENGSEAAVAGKIRKCAEAGFWSFCPGMCGSDRPLTRREADEARDAGLSFRNYGVNTPEALRAARDNGAEAFTCNYWRQAFGWARELGGITLLA